MSIPALDGTVECNDFCVLIFLILIEKKKLYLLSLYAEGILCHEQSSLDKNELFLMRIHTRFMRYHICFAMFAMQKASSSSQEIEPALT